MEKYTIEAYIKKSIFNRFRPKIHYKLIYHYYYEHDLTYGNGGGTTELGSKVLATNHDKNILEGFLDKLKESQE